MTSSARAADLSAILPWREMYRREMNCQVVHDSLHSRPGWSAEFLLFAGRARAGYGSVALAGPWAGKPTIYEFFVLPEHRLRAFSLFEALLAASGAVMVNVQTNDPLITVMLHTYTHRITTESIIFHDRLATNLRPAGASFRTATPADAIEVASDQLPWHGVVEVDGTRAASGGILLHYNEPFGDVYMDVVETYRRRGLGAFIVQELKRVCYEAGRVPAARCRPENVASRLTLQKAGFVPCGNILNGLVATIPPCRSSRESSDV